MTHVNIDWFVPPEHRCLTTEEVKKVTDGLDLCLDYPCTPELEHDYEYPDLAFVIARNISKTIKSLDVLDEKCNKLPEVKYPRVPGHRPKPPDENGDTSKAWAWCCDIQGAPEGKLAGKKIALKDDVAVAGMPMFNGSPVPDGYVPEYDASVVTRILEAGGRIVGKASCDDFLGSAAGYNSIIRYESVPNSYHKRLGGFEGGAANLVAKGEVDLAVAGDQGGSICIPSALRGVVGMKPTYGLVPYTGIVSIEPCLDHAGLVARNVTDCALFLEVLAGNNGVDPRQTMKIAVPEYSKLLETSSSFTLGRLTEGFDICYDYESGRVKEFLDSAAESGKIEMTEVSVPLHESGFPVIIPLLTQGAKPCLEMETTLPFIDGFHSVPQGAKSCGRLFSPAMKQFIIMGEILTRRYGNRYYDKAKNIVLEMSRQFDSALEECDVIVMPTSPMFAPSLIMEPTFSSSRYNSDYASPSDSVPTTKNTAVFNLTGHPALTIKLKSGTGLLIVGRKFDDLKVLQVGRALEKFVSELESQEAE